MRIIACVLAFLVCAATGPTAVGRETLAAAASIDSRVPVDSGIESSQDWTVPGTAVVSRTGNKVVLPSTVEDLTWFHRGRCNTDPRPNHPACVTVSGRVADTGGRPVPGFLVFAWTRIDGYRAKPGFDDYDENTFRPDATDPWLHGQRFSEEGIYVHFSRDAAVTDADGRFTLPGIYAGEVTWIGGWFDGDNPNDMGGNHYYQAMANFDIEFPFPTTDSRYEFGAAFMTDSVTPDIVAIPANEVGVHLYQADSVTAVEYPDEPMASAERWGATYSYSLLVTHPSPGPGVVDKFRWGNAESQVRDLKGNIVIPWTEQTASGGGNAFLTNYGSRDYSSVFGPYCGTVVTDNGVSRIGDVQVRAEGYFGDDDRTQSILLGTAEITIPFPADVCNAEDEIPAVLPFSRPKIVGTPRVGKRVHARSSNLGLVDVDYSWRVSGISREFAGRSLTITKMMLGRTITAVATGHLAEVTSTKTSTPRRIVR